MHKYARARYSPSLHVMRCRNNGTTLGDTHANNIISSNTIVATPITMTSLTSTTRNKTSLVISNTPATTSVTTTDATISICAKSIHNTTTSTARNAAGRQSVCVDCNRARHHLARCQMPIVSSVVGLCECITRPRPAQLLHQREKTKHTVDRSPPGGWK